MTWDLGHHLMLSLETVFYLFSPIALKGKPEVGNFTFALLGFSYVIN